MNYLIIRAHEGMQLVVSMILHVLFFGLSDLIYSPTANKYTGLFSATDGFISRQPRLQTKS